MSDLIEALTIFLKYGDYRNPTICEHDVLTIASIDPYEVTPEDRARLNVLGFSVSEADRCFKSFRYGSA
jgi:hypothetical protein